MRSLVNQVDSQNRELRELKSSVAKLQEELDSEMSVNRDLDSLNSQIAARSGEVAKCHSEMDTLLGIARPNRNNN